MKKDIVINWLITMAVIFAQRFTFPEDGWPTTIQVVILFGVLCIYDEVKK
jgi:hypothetical protein